MVDVIEQNRYISYMMNRLPEEEASETKHTLRRGESLWEIAKESLGGGRNLSNAEISEYMLRIAKLNGLDTYEKMNNIRPNTELRMPKTQNITVSTSTRIGNRGNAARPAERSRAEQSALQVLSTLLNDRTVNISAAAISIGSNLYHVCKRIDSPGYISRNTPVISFNMGDDGRLIEAHFEDKDTNQYIPAYDYTLDSTGRIFKVKAGLPPQQVGRLNNEEMTQLTEKLRTLRSTVPARERIRY